MIPTLKLNVQKRFSEYLPSSPTICRLRWLVSKITFVHFNLIVGSLDYLKLNVQKRFSEYLPSSPTICRLRWLVSKITFVHFNLIVGSLDYLKLNVQKRFCEYLPSFVMTDLLLCNKKF
jgi:hypothetical protein